MFHQVAIAYLMQKTPYVFPIVGGRKVEHLMANIEALEITLSNDQIKYLESVVPFEPGFPYWVIVSCLPLLFFHGHFTTPYLLFLHRVMVKRTLACSAVVTVPKSLKGLYSNPSVLEIYSKQQSQVERYSKLGILDIVRCVLELLVYNNFLSHLRRTT